MVNKAQVLGRVGKIDTKQLPQGGQVTNISMATNKKYTKDGQKVEKVMWHNISLFSKLSEIAEKYVKVGDLLWIEGEMCSDKYVGQDNIERNKFYLIAHQLELMPKGASNQVAPVKPEQDPFAKSQETPFDDSEIPF